MAKSSRIWASLSGISCGKVVGLGPVFVKVVQLPAVVVGCPVLDARWQSRQPGHARAER